MGGARSADLRRRSDRLPDVPPPGSSTRSYASVGTRTAVSSPARNSRASCAASYLSCLRWTPGFVGTSDGAMTVRGTPQVASSRCRT